MIFKTKRGFILVGKGDVCGPLSVYGSRHSIILGYRRWRISFNTGGR